ncbi:hypothetical protein WJX74_003207 [Apatococcus lobatus]|uniref:Uncharacterized protein n=1 Tax=Apatococcus lobatus TaxID=904363 RepID=A0AAW1QGY0_9CHLO
MAPGAAGNTGKVMLLCLRRRPFSFKGRYEKAPLCVGDKTLTGRWKKDASRSDKMDKGMDLIQLGWALRKGMAIVTALLIEDTPDHFATLIEALGVFKVREQYPWTGELTQQKRRDMRDGKTEGKVTRGSDGSAIVE